MYLFRIEDFNLYFKFSACYSNISHISTFRQVIKRERARAREYFKVSKLKIKFQLKQLNVH
jgi:hypothetical protein